MLRLHKTEASIFVGLGLTTQVAPLWFRKTGKGQFYYRGVSIPGKAKPWCSTGGAESPYNICSDKKSEPRQEGVCLRENYLLEDRRLLRTDSVLQKCPGQGYVRETFKPIRAGPGLQQRYSRHSRALPDLAPRWCSAGERPGCHSIPELVTPPLSCGNTVLGTAGGAAGGALLFPGLAWACFPQRGNCLPPMNTAEQAATEIQPCYEVA